MSNKLKSLLVNSFLKKSKDGNTEGLFQGSSSSSLRRQALMRAAEADFPGHAVAFMNEVII
jgi:queuine/archaeosine tRNA-ribosyltransferase